MVRLRLPFRDSHPDIGYVKDGTSCGLRLVRMHRKWVRTWLLNRTDLLVLTALSNGVRLGGQKSPGVSLLLFSQLRPCLLDLDSQTEITNPDVETLAVLTHPLSQKTDY
ncbi:hypothetical protein U0070_022350 [Myodes glareolus]|uniref:Uncharacterized protein n=1 Tax=Myodes glareolus TaxID=447135 RepID=A0AAW0HZU5_MYOGA